jgi:hypothetical protein
MKRLSTLIGAVVLAALVGIHFAPLLTTHPEQDLCAFGPVTNERYRELLAEAKRRQTKTWPPIAWENDNAARNLTARFDDLSRGSSSIYERLAAMHAVLRALGGLYRNTASDEPDPYTGAFRQAGTVTFNYNIDVNRLGFFAPFWRESWVIGSLAVGTEGGTYLPQLRKPGEISFIVWLPERLDTYPAVRPSVLAESCPRGPDDQWAERLNKYYLDQR